LKLVARVYINMMRARHQGARIGEAMSTPEPLPLSLCGGGLA
jgi:hypothetical protein